MDEIEKRVLDWLTNHPAEELTVIKSAPLAFAVAVLIAGTLLYFFWRWSFQHKVDTRDEIIASKNAIIAVHEERHKLKDEQIAAALAKQATLSNVDLRPDIEALKAALMEPQPLVPLESTRLDPRVAESDKGITYKAKVVASFVNRSDRTIYLLPPSWIAGPDDVGIQSPFSYRYRVDIEGQEKEFTETIIEPNVQFRVWVGLDKSVSHDDLEKRRKNSQLGFLRIPVKVDEKEATLVYRI